MPKAKAEPKASSSADTKPAQAEVERPMETPRNYGDPLPVLRSVAGSKTPGAAVAKELQAMVEKYTFLNPETARCRHPLHCWVGRCAQLLGEQNAEKVEEAKACLARVNTGLMTDVSRVYTAFRRFDVDESNHLDDQELSRLAAYLGFDVDPMDLDHNDDGKISLTEFQDFVGRMGGVQTLFEQRRKRIAEGRRDAASFAGVAVGARVQAHYWVGVKPDRRKSEQPAEAIVMGVHYTGDQDIACAPQLEVQLQFLRQDPQTLQRMPAKLTCVPSHWIISSEEDAQVAEALREVGIHEEDQPFWDAVFPASEMQEVCRLTQCQRRALAQVRAQATASHQAAYDNVLERFQALGYEDKELQAVLSWVQDLAPVIIHVHLDTVGRFLESDEYYRSQFETKTSCGALDDDNGIRIRWERDLFGDAYEDATPFERCKYGALNVTNDFEGCKSACQYGDSYLVLKDVRLRCTFASTDSGGIEGSRLAVLDKYAHVLAEYADDEITGLVEVATAPPPRPVEEVPRLLRGKTENSTVEWVTFGFPQLIRKEGCFFFEVELMEGCSLPQVGLASEQFHCFPGVESNSGIGDDEYSCGVDGLHGACLKNGPLSSWKADWPKKMSGVLNWDDEREEELLAKKVVVGVLVDFQKGQVGFVSEGNWEDWSFQLVDEDLPCFHNGLFPAISVKGSAAFHFDGWKYPPPKERFGDCGVWPKAGLGPIRIDCPAVGNSAVLNIYKEAQIHGEVCLKRHVLRLVANSKYRKKSRSWTIKVTGAGARCNGTYVWSGRHNKRSFYKEKSGAIIYYNQQDAAWRMNLKEDFTSFIFQAPNKARMLSNIAGGSSEPPRMGWKPACELKGRVAVELFREAMRQPLQVPSEELERFVKVLRGVGDEQNFVFRKLEETSFKAEWNRLNWPLHHRPLSAALAWAEVVRIAQREFWSKLELPQACAVAISPSPDPDDSWECLLSLNPQGKEEPESEGVALHVVNLQGTPIDLSVSAPVGAWRSAGVGARAAVALASGWLGGRETVPGTIVERGPGTLRRLQLDSDALTRNDTFWALQEMAEGEVHPSKDSISGRWTSRSGGRCALNIDDSEGFLWLLRNGNLSQDKLQEMTLRCEYHAETRTFSGSAVLEEDLLSLSLVLSSDGLQLAGTMASQEVSFRRMTNEPSFLWCSSDVSLFKEPSFLKRIRVTYNKNQKASEELRFALHRRWPFTPIVLEGFGTPSGPAQAAKVRSGWYLDIRATFFGERSRIFQDLAAHSNVLESIDEAYRQIDTLFQLLLRALEKAPLCLVFINALEVEPLPEAQIHMASGVPLREQLGEVEQGKELCTIKGRGLQRGSPVFAAGVRGGWQLDLCKSLQLTSRHLGRQVEVPAEELSAFVLDSMDERILFFRQPDDVSEPTVLFRRTDESSETEAKSGVFQKPLLFEGTDSVLVRCEGNSDASADRHLLVLVPTGLGCTTGLRMEQLQKLAEGWEASCDRLFGLKGEEVSVERDSWDEIRLRALCAHHGWEFSWMTEDDERRRRILQGDNRLQ